jgi:hypothetical protein
MDALEKADKLTAVSLADRLRQFAEAAGINGGIKTLAAVSLGILWGALIRLADGLPFWADCLLGLAFSIACTHLYNALRVAWSLRGLKAQDITELGKQCLEFRDDVFRYLLERQGSAPRTLKTHDGAAGSESIGRFMPRLLAIARLLKNAGIRPPDTAGFDRNPSSAAAYVGALGVLLEQGLLSVAREFDPED